MPFTVLSDANVRHILSTLAPQDVTSLVTSLESALVAYSCGDEAKYQPHRAVMARPDGQSTLFMPASTPDLVGTKIVGIRPTHVPARLLPSGVPEPGLKSVLTLCDETGQAIGVLNAAALTAFRTALGSMLLYRFRSVTERIVVFGAGKQAVWHLQLASLLRGRDIRSVTVVNRSAARTQALIDSLTKDPRSEWPAHISIDVFDGGDDRDAKLEKLVADADVIFCTTPSTEPLFPASYLTSETARAKTRFISAIGSYKLNMQEIDPEYLKLVADPASDLAGAAYKGGVITVDSLEGCLAEAGELVKAEIPTTKLVEIGRLLDPESTANADELKKWLETGLVIYKSVGIGIMDLAIGKALLQLGREKDVGITTDDF